MALSVYDEFWLKVKIQSAKRVFGLGCEIIYPTHILEAVVDEEGKVQTQLGDFFERSDAPPMLNAWLEDNKPGRIVVALSKWGEEKESAGEGSLFDVLFRCVGAGRADIRFTQPRVFNAEVEDSPSQWAAVSVEVSPINLVSAEIVPRGVTRSEIPITWQIAG